MRVTFRRSQSFHLKPYEAAVTFREGETADIPAEHAAAMLESGAAIETKGGDLVPSEVVDTKADTEAIVKKKGKK
jgi:hypothetical protein